MPRHAKRHREPEVVDLTDDAPTTRPAKVPRYPPSSYSSQSAAPGPSQPSTSAYAPVPSSAASVPSATQRYSANDELEPSTQDLTQSDDGPQRELYGSLGMCPVLFMYKTRQS
jgi:SWI/SNF-related matrix-associated actin-dependent regulator of chromatin subfamily A3